MSDATISSNVDSGQSSMLGSSNAAAKAMQMQRMVTVAQSVSASASGGSSDGSSIDPTVDSSSSDAAALAESTVLHGMRREDLHGRVLLDTWGRCFEEGLRIDSISILQGQRMW